MASKPEDAGDLSNLVGTPESPYYDPEMIADEAMWPLVDHLWRGDWRSDAFPGQTFVFPKTGIDEDNRHLIVTLMAEQAPDETNSSEGSKGLYSEATLIIEEILPEPVRSHIIRGLVEDNYSMFRGYEVNEFVVKSGSAYQFDNYGSIGIDLYQEIEEPSEGLPLWHTGEEADADSDEEGIVAVGMEQGVKIRDHDLESMELAFSILESPEELLEILQWIKQEKAIRS